MSILNFDLSKEIDYFNLIEELMKIKYPINLDIKQKLNEFINFDGQLLFLIENDCYPSSKSPTEMIKFIVSQILHKEQIYNEFFDLNKKDENAAGRWILEFFEDCFDKEEYEKCNNFLTDIDISLLQPFLLVTILTVTSPLKNKLIARKDFYIKVKEQITKLRGPERTEKILIGLE